ncbi:hypothetical protein NDU88_005631 [Pleurodeles waltl]|uniref:Uncharacterized protein n=1 Tax=Pleurodeles waltl TaxID=8319 RepID=A0AAV7MZX4_PLEWA|nr:hypothetical protein NDU88_005631 [Pleurodeles waltl]
MARRKKIQVMGVRERTAGPSIKLFLEDLVSQTLPLKRLSHFTIKRAHGAPILPPKTKVPPRTIIARMFKHRDHDAILQAVHVQGDVRFENVTLRFFPDFTLQVRLYGGQKSIVSRGTEIYDAVPGQPLCDREGQGT